LAVTFMDEESIYVLIFGRKHTRHTRKKDDHGSLARLEKQIYTVIRVQRSIGSGYCIARVAERDNDTDCESVCL
jgi:hypothetical protein